MDDPMQSIIEQLRRERMPRSVIAATRDSIRSEAANAPRVSRWRWASVAVSGLGILAVSVVIISQRPDTSTRSESEQHVQAFVETIQSLNVVSEALVTAGQKGGAILVSEAVIPWKDRFKSAKEKLNQAISNI